MPRYRLDIEYDGSAFVGWQIQGEGQSVQGTLRDAVHAFAGEWIEVRGAGRTDAGVHALGQVAHIDLVRDWPEHVVREALNHHVRPAPVAVLAARKVAPTFDARFGAIRRSYRYRILNRRGAPALDQARVWWVARALDVDAMIDAATVFVGHHDFTTFRAAQCQARSPLKTLDRFAVAPTGDEIWIDVAARSFLHNQVRSMVGSLKLVGDGRWTRADLAGALAARDRSRCGPVAPPQGLYLVRVEYPADLG